MIWLHTLLACELEPPPQEAPPTPFEACEEGEIDRLAKKHAFTRVFDACKANMFSDFGWSTDGHRLYFQGGMTVSVLDAASRTKQVKVAPTPTPIGSGTWVTPTRLVLPVGPLTDGPEEAPPRIVIHDTDTNAVFGIDLDGLAAPDDLQRGAKPTEVLFTAKRANAVDGPRQVFQLDLQSGFVTEPFPWLAAVDTFSWSPLAQGLVVGVGNTVTLYDPAGKSKGLWSPATRGTLHPAGRWLVLEHIGEPVSVFHPTGIEELPASEGQARVRQAAERASKLPPDMDRTVRPPMLSFVDTTTAKRFLITGVQGSRFEWWENKDFFGSFVSWGFEQRQFRRNVLLGDLASWLHAAEQGRTILGVRALSAESVTEVPEPAAPPAP